MQAAEPRKIPEPLRILLFLLLIGAASFLTRQGNLVLIRCIEGGGMLSGLSLGQWLAVTSLLDALLFPLVMMLLYRRFVFRSKRPLRTCILPTVCFLVGWMLVRSVLSSFGVTESGDEAAGWTAFLQVIAYAAQYLFYRLYLFRDTIDTI